MSRDYWEQRYQTKEMSWEKGAPSPGLVDFLTAHRDLKRGTVCVPGCGTGHDVRAFAAAGFEAFGFDIASSAIVLATEKTGRAAGSLGAPASCRRAVADGKHAGKMPALPGEAKFQLADFLHDAPPQKFDWLFEHTLFCAIQPGERDDYVRAVLRWLKPDGNYLAVNYFDCGPDGPPWPTTRAEQLERFSPHFDLLADWVPRSYPNREGKERMFHWRLKAI
jgi:SAM-dependent methyltransferase